MQQIYLAALDKSCRRKPMRPYSTGNFRQLAPPEGPRGRARAASSAWRPRWRRLQAYYISLYHTRLYYIILYDTILSYYTILYYVIIHYIIPYCTILYCTVLYCTVLYCTVLYYRLPGAAAALPGPPTPKPEPLTP